MFKPYVNQSSSLTVVKTMFPMFTHESPCLFLAFNVFRISLTNKIYKRTPPYENNLGLPGGESSISHYKRGYDPDWLRWFEFMTPTESHNKSQPCFWTDFQVQESAIFMVCCWMPPQNQCYMSVIIEIMIRNSNMILYSYELCEQEGPGCKQKIQGHFRVEPKCVSQW